MPAVRVPEFLPSTRGLHFANYFPHEPEIQIQLPVPLRLIKVKSAVPHDVGKHHKEPPAV